MVGWITTPAPDTMDMPVLISQNLWIWLYTGDLADMIKLRILENYPRLYEWALYNPRDSYNRETGDQKDKKLWDDENRDLKMLYCWLWRWCKRPRDKEYNSMSWKDEERGFPLVKHKTTTLKWSRYAKPHITKSSLNYNLCFLTPSPSPSPHLLLIWLPSVFPLYLRDYCSGILWPLSYSHLNVLVYIISSRGRSGKQGKYKAHRGLKI